MVSFYTLPSSVLGHEEHKELRAAYMYYSGGPLVYNYRGVTCLSKKKLTS